MSDDTVYEGEIEDGDSGPSMAIDTITRAEIDIQVSTAKRYPRNLATVKRDMVAMATLDEETAESCFYSLKRKDADGTMKVIQGPSVRMAEIALSCFGNLRAGTRSLGESEDGKFVRELGICHDVEKNVMVAREVKRRITRRDGKKFGDDMIGTTMAAAGSIAFRNAVLTVVPRALIKPAYEKAREVATGKTKSLVVRRGEVIARLQKLSPLITSERILFAVGRATMDEVGWTEIEYLIGLGTSVKDGMTSVEDAFPENVDDVAQPVTVADIRQPKPEPAPTPTPNPIVPPAAQEEPSRPHPDVILGAALGNAFPRVASNGESVAPSPAPEPEKTPSPFPSRRRREPGPVRRSEYIEALAAAAAPVLSREEIELQAQATYGKPWDHLSDTAWKALSDWVKGEIERAES